MGATRKYEVSLQNRESWCTVYPLGTRGVAQPGSAPALGAGSRGFKSRRPDQPSLAADAASYGSARRLRAKAAAPELRSNKGGPPTTQSEFFYLCSLAFAKKRL